MGRECGLGCLVLKKGGGEWEGGGGREWEGVRGRTWEAEKRGEGAR